MHRQVIFSTHLHSRMPARKTATNVSCAAFNRHTAPSNIYEGLSVPDQLNTLTKSAADEIQDETVCAVIS